MYRQNMYYHRYSNFGYMPNTTYYPYYYPQYQNFNNNLYDNNTKHEEFKKDSENTFKEIDVEKKDANKIQEERKKEKSNNFRIGPLSFSNENISIFGLSLAIDDLILIGIIIILLFEPNRDYTLIIVLGLILFNFSFSNVFNLLNIFK